MSILSQVAPSIQVINVQKRRKLHVWPSDDRNGTIIDLTEISIPEKVVTSVLNTRIWRKLPKLWNTYS
jgi:hypothetical protein